MNGGWGAVGTRHIEDLRPNPFAPDRQSYRRIVATLRRLQAHWGRRMEIRSRVGDDTGPILTVRLSGHDDAPEALILTGVHGDEPAGVLAVLQLLMDPPGDLTERVSLTIMPCLNPHGYRRAVRGEASGLDLNWCCDCNLPAIRALHRVLAGRRFDTVVDLHEDWETQESYIYELAANPGLSRAGRVTAALQRALPVCMDERIDHAPAEKGVIRPDPYYPLPGGGEGIPQHVFAHHTPRYLIVETPSTAPLPARVQAQQLAIRAALGLEVGGTTGDRPQ